MNTTQLQMDTPAPITSMTIFEHVANEYKAFDIWMFCSIFILCIAAASSYIHFMVPDARKSKWWLFSTAVAVSISISLLIYIDIDKLEKLGGFLAGVLSPLAIAWFVAAFMQQSEELRMQRDELELQRIAIQQQTREWHDMKVFEAMGKAEQIMVQFENEHKRSNQFELHSLYNSLESLLRSCRDYVPEPEVYRYMDYDPFPKLKVTIENCEKFLTKYLSIVDFYCQATNTPRHDNGSSLYDSVCTCPRNTIHTISTYELHAKSIAKLLRDSVDLIAKYEHEYREREKKDQSIPLVRGIQRSR